MPLLIDALKDSDVKVREAAALALGRIGPAARPAIKPLIAVLGIPPSPASLDRQASLRALQAIGVNAVPALVEALQQKDRSVRDGAGQVLVQIGPKAKDASPALVALLKDGDEAVGHQAMLVLNAIGADAVPALLAGFKDVDNQKAYLVLGRLHEKGAKAVPDLIQALHDKDPEMRQRAAEALGLIGLAAVDAAPALKEALQDQSMGVRRAAAEALTRMGQKTQAGGGNKP